MQTRIKSFCDCLWSEVRFNNNKNCKKKKRFSPKWKFNRESFLIIIIHWIGWSDCEWFFFVVFIIYKSETIFTKEVAKLYYVGNKSTDTNYFFNLWGSRVAFLELIKSNVMCNYIKVLRNFMIGRGW